jgi:hypothetical protein
LIAHQNYFIAKGSPSLKLFNIEEYTSIAYKICDAKEYLYAGISKCPSDVHILRKSSPTEALGTSLQGPLPSQQDCNSEVIDKIFKVV